ncbi:hypothetical protein [Allomuricauda sp. d1]|uniref:hypothetical protein n=1 Tax=Allomuricauda sp. d1 TaxID=3136725 RepID=UPI0031D4AFFC
MKRVLLLFFVGTTLYSCIPLSIAPNIKDYKITKGKRFKRGLPKKTVFVFEDPKDAEHFYNYVNTKFNLQDYYVDVEVPFQLDGHNYFFSYYEVEKKDKTLNLFPLMVDATVNAALNNEDFETYLASEENSIQREHSWYIAIEVFSDVEKDCLHENYANRAAILTYLRDLKKEYLSTHNYNEVVFKN